jgi:enamine deaminase RidA (YjgF/YER057c/UK114 family)
MSRVTVFNAPELSPPVGFVHATEANGWVFLAGQISTDASGKLLFPGDMAAQFRQAIQNVARALESAGSAPENVVKVTYFVTDMKAYRESLQAIGESYREAFGRHYPAASLLEVQGLFEAGALIEIECVAVGSGTSNRDPKDAA